MIMSSGKVKAESHIRNRKLFLRHIASYLGGALLRDKKVECAQIFF